jgi:hypothetical protein
MTVPLVYLMDEICAGAEIYFTGRTGGQYLKTAFILCDDYTELASKLFLLLHNHHWSDARTGGGFKNYTTVLQEARGVIQAIRSNDLPAVQALHDSMQERRTRRNGFFHSAQLLDLHLAPRHCVEAFCDLFEYGGQLFPGEWATALSATRNLDTMEILFRLERRSFNDPSLLARVQQIIQHWPRNRKNAARSGVHLAVHPEDLHLRMTITQGYHELRDRLSSLL